MGFLKRFGFLDYAAAVAVIAAVATGLTIWKKSDSFFNKANLGEGVDPNIRREFAPPRREGCVGTCPPFSYVNLPVDIPKVDGTVYVVETGPKVGFSLKMPTVAKIHLDDGTSPISLVLSSMWTTRWHIEAAHPERIQKIYLAHPEGVKPHVHPKSIPVEDLGMMHTEIERPDLPALANLTRKIVRKVETSYQREIETEFHVPYFKSYAEEVQRQKDWKKQVADKKFSK